MAALTTPRATGVVERSPAGGADGRLGGTPGRLSALMVLLAVVAIGAGAASVVDVAGRSATLDSVRQRGGPLTVQAQELYRSLSDADATAAAAFLSGGQEPATLRQRYQDDIAAATAALATAASADGDQPTVRRIAARLPVYTGLVETARADNRQNLPVGAAYLREASALMRTELLVAAEQLYDAETARVAADRRAASGFPWLAVALLVVAVAGLVYAQVHLTRRTNRLVNLGLLAATVLALAALGWLVSAASGVRGELAAAHRDGSSQVQLLARARLDALRARADESLTLIARGNGADFEKDYAAADADLGRLLGEARTAAGDPAVRDSVAVAASDAGTWRAGHAKVRGFDEGGQYGDAVAQAIGPDSDAVNRLDADLARGIGLTNAAFDRRAAAAAGALDGAAAGLSVLTVLVVAGLVFGLRQRIAEYR